MAAQAAKLNKRQKGEIMNKKILVAAVAAAFAAPAAFAQSSVTIGGTINILWDNVRANGATNTATNSNMASHDRVRDGAGSNIQFSVIEDLGGGTSAFAQVESAVIVNSDQRADMVGNAGQTAAVWGTRNSAVGIRSKTMGRFLIGVWDMHYHEHYAIDPGWIIANSAGSTLALTQNMGSAFSVNPTFGSRYSNTIKWDSPNWSGFSISAQYARPTDGAPVNSAGSVRDNKKNRAWHFAPRYQSGGLSVVYSYLQDKDALTTASLSFGGVTTSLAATSAWKIRSHRLGARYKFANGFGIGAIWDSGKVEATHEGAIGGTSIKRTAWEIPLTFDTGNHHVYGTYGRARDWKGTIGGFSVGDISPVVGTNLGSDTGAKMFTLGYAYNLSQRTNVSVSYARISNEALARYDGFANTYGTTAANFGADPRSLALGFRHTF
jgi:predicted porin